VHGVETVLLLVAVATVVAADDPVAQEAAVLEFLNGDLVLNWAKVVLGL